MIKVPKYLKKGDTIGIVCPAGYMPLEKIQTCIDTLQQWGYKVKLGKTPGNQFNYFSGTDEERLQDLQMMLDDKSVDAVLCGRGGYGVSRIIDGLNFKAFKKNPKWVIGFSDITVLHAHIHETLKIATLHAPMAGAFNDGGFENEYVLSLQKALKGTKAKYDCKPNALDRIGKAEGVLVGGNLSIVAHLVGSNSAYKTKGKILFLEDVGEYIYNVDRMMVQLKRSGVLADLAGLVIGGFSDMKDTTIPFGADGYHLINEHVKEYNYPVCYDFPVSHEKENYALKVGIKHQLTVTGKKVQLREL
ncbi:LD-carboxypeptidase [Chitinophagaceae bacterium LWZ2-11]